MSPGASGLVLRLLIALVVALPTAAIAQAVVREPEPALGDEVPEAFYRSIPEPWRGYFRAARKAESIASPLERCLAYPDLPGNAWPQGHAEAHCRNHYDLQQLPLEQIDALIAAGDIAALDARLDALQALHAQGREDVHYVFDQFAADPQGERIAGAWLQAAPDSPYAAVALARVYGAKAWQERGGEYASKTPADAIRKMEEQAERSISLYRQAAERMPALMPAYEGTLAMGMVASRGDDIRRAWEQAAAVDASCVSIARNMAVLLRPRWGGSHWAMARHAANLEALMPRQPLLALYAGSMYEDQASQRMEQDLYDRQTAELIDSAVSAGSNESALVDAGSVHLNLDTPQADDLWKGYAALLQSERFKPGKAWAARQLAWMLVQGDPRWAARQAARAVQRDPDKAEGHYLLGAASWNYGDHLQAQREYLIAIEDASQRRAALRELSQMLLYDVGRGNSAGGRQAQPYVERLLREYPDDGRAWIMRLDVDIVTGAAVDEDLVQQAWQRLDRDDPWQARQAARIERIHRQIFGDRGSPGTVTP